MTCPEPGQLFGRRSGHPSGAQALPKKPSTESQFVKAALWLYLLSGVRKNELLKAKWSDIDWESKTLKLCDTKTDEDRDVALSEPALAILRELPRLAGNPFIFPGRNEGCHLVNIDKAWRRIRARAGLEDVWIHDLRRSVGSFLAQSGNTLLLIQKALGHKSYAATLTYARMSEDPVRKAMEAHGTEMLAAAGKAEPAKVLPMKRKGRYGETS